jgi:hypothetical protein
MQVCHRWMPIRAVTKPACTSKVRSRWSILLTPEKLNEGAKSLQLAYENKSMFAGTCYRLTLFAACLQKGRKTQ